MKKSILLTLVIFLCFFCACTTPSPSTGLPALSSEEQSYASALQDNVNMVANALKELASLMTEFQIGNDEWTLDVATQLVIIQLAYDEAIQMNPPDSMAHIHYKYIQAMNDFNDATDLIASGIDNLDASMIEQATSKMQSGTEYLTEATDLVNAFKAAHK